jgi:hypothetical protein
MIVLDVSLSLFLVVCAKMTFSQVLRFLLREDYD